MSEQYTIDVHTRKKITLMTLKRAHPDLFYPQDWYENELFAHQALVGVTHQFTLTPCGKGLVCDDHLHGRPQAVACALAFIREFHEGNILWPDNYVWCEDTDSNDDRVYVGGFNLGHRKGFQIHRFLTIRDYFHCIDYESQ